MKSSVKTIVGLTAVIGLLGAMAIFKSQPKAQERFEQKNTVAQLIEGEGPDNLTDNCLPPQGVLKEELVKYQHYTLVSYKIDPQKSLPKPSHEFPKSNPVDLDRETGHDHKFGRPYPNIDVAIMVLDPTEGCKPTIRSMRAEPLPNSWPQKDRVKLKKVYWALVLKNVEEQNVTAQSWMDDQMNYIGPGMTYFSDNDVRAITALGLKVPKWYDLKLPPEKRRQLHLDAGSRTVNSPDDNN